MFTFTLYIPIILIMAHISSSVNNAVFNNDLKKLAELISEGKRIDIHDNLGYTPLHIAAKKMRHGALKMLLLHPDCPINERNFEGCTSLYLLCENKSPCRRLVRDLLIKGADPNISNNEQMSPLHLACKNENLQLVKILVEHGADINAQEVDNYTPLHFAVEGKEKKIVEYLLEKEAATNIANCHGLKPLMLAIVRKKEDIFDIILPHTEDLNELDYLNDSAVILAININNLGIVKKLVENGADICNNSDYSPLGCINLFEEKNLEIFKYIWSKQNYKSIVNNTHFIILLLRNLSATSNLKNLEIILETKDLNLKSVFRKADSAFGNIFFTTNLPDLSYFEHNKDSLIVVIKGLLNQNVQINDKNLEIFMNFIKNCPYRKDLLKLVLTESSYTVYSNLLFSAFLVHPELGITLLQNCPYYFNQNDIFEKINPENLESVKHIFLYFSPSVVVLNQLQLSLNDEFSNKVLETFSGSPHSLLEISRNVVRKYIGQNIMKGYKSIFFWEAIENLNCPSIVKDIILLKKAVNNITL